MKKILKKLIIFGVISTLLGIGLVVINEKKDLWDFKIADLRSLKTYDDFSSKNILVIERRKGGNKIIFSKNRKEKVEPASLTKIMTAWVALEHIEDLQGQAPIDVESYRDMITKNASMAGFYGYEKTTYQDLLYGTLLASGGEAANTLAIRTAGSKEVFIEWMNDKAKELKLKNTHYSNPEGLHEKEEYTTADDIATVLDAALENKNFRQIFTSRQYRSSSTADHPQGVLIESTVLRWILPEDEKDFQIIGGKSGTTMDAGACWATLATKDQREYIVVVMGSPLEDLANKEMLQKRDTLELLKRI
ncbi:MAG: serine hydrolase [Tissierellia bacterium]|nr:serine hydrolase [Tissierellia bacterium]